MFIEIRDDVIWIKHLANDPKLHSAVSNLREAETITLSVDGVTGKWERMKTGRDGRPTMGIKPVGAMSAVWARLQRRRGDKVRLELPDEDRDGLLGLADETFDEWYSAEDEEAYGDLRPL